MANKMISIPDELLEKLKASGNASGLIQNLLNKYYDNALSDDDYDELMKLKREEIEAFVQRKQLEIEDIKRNQKQIQEKMHAIVIEQQRAENKQKREREWRNQFFKEITNRDMTDQEYEDFVNRWQKGDCTIVHYANEIKAASQRV